MRIQWKFDWNIVYRSKQVKHFWWFFFPLLRSFETTSTCQKSWKARFVCITEQCSESTHTHNIVERFKRILSCSISDVFIYDNLNSEMLHDDKWLNVRIFNERQRKWVRKTFDIWNKWRTCSAHCLLNARIDTCPNRKWEQIYPPPSLTLSFSPWLLHAIRHRSNCDSKRRWCHFA